MQTNDYYKALEMFFRDSIRRIATIKPAIVQSVEGNRVRVKPLTKTLYKDGTQLECPELFDVPLLIYSAKKGSARVTVPVSRGDLVVVLFSDRDLGNLLNENITTPTPQDGDELWCLGMYPIMALPCFFTIPQETDIDSENIVIENGTSFITVAPSGDMEIESTGNVNTTCVQSNTTCEQANITATTGLNVTTPIASFSGIVTASAFQIGPVGAPVVEITDATFNIDGMNIVLTGGDLVADGISSKTHTHDYVADGTSKVTDTPNPT